MYLILILSFLKFLAITAVELQSYEIFKNQTVRSPANCISNIYEHSKVLCIASCNLNSQCVSGVYDIGMIFNCFHYNKYFNSSEMIPLSTSEFYQKKQINNLSPQQTALPTTISTVSTMSLSNNFLYLFSNGVINPAFPNTNPIVQSMNLDRATINGSQYNLVFDYPVGVHLFDSNWIFKSTFSMQYIYGGIVANNCFYFIIHPSNSIPYGIIKTSLNSPAVINSYGYPDGYRGLCYDSIGSRVIAAGCTLNVVHIFDLNLNLITTVSFPGQGPYSVVVYNSKIYTAIYGSNNVHVISNGVIESTYTTQCNALVRISVDSLGYFSLSCGDGYVYLQDSNMQFTNKSIAFSAVDSRLDTNDRLTVLGGNTITIYN